MLTAIKLIDNTKTGSLLDDVYVEGYSHISKQLFPNKGIVKYSKDIKSGSEVYFYNYGMHKYKDMHLINSKNVFMVNNKLVKEGVVVVRQRHKQGMIRTQEWFVVEQANCEVPVGSIVVSVAGTAYKFNQDKKQKSFISRDNILFYLANKGINVTSDKIILDKIPPKPFQKQKALCGTLEGKTHYFYRAEAFLNKQIIVKKEYIYAIA